MISLPKKFDFTCSPQKQVFTAEEREDGNYRIKGGGRVLVEYVRKEHVSKMIILGWEIVGEKKYTLDTSEGNNSRWHVYSYLKAVNGQVRKGELEERFPNIKYTELIEGVLEYDLVARSTDAFFEPFKVIEA